MLDHDDRITSMCMLDDGRYMIGYSKFVIIYDYVNQIVLHKIDLQKKNPGL